MYVGGKGSPERVYLNMGMAVSRIPGPPTHGAIGKAVTHVDQAQEQW